MVPTDCACRVSSNSEGYEIDVRGTIQGVLKAHVIDMGDVANWNQFAVMLKDSDELPPEIRRTIKKVKQGAHGVEVEFYDKNRAIQLLANFFGLTQDLAPKVEIQIITGVPRLSYPPPKAPPVIDVEKVG